MGFLLDKAVLGQVFSKYFSLPCQSFHCNKLLLYKTILKPIWTYGIQLWGTASTSNIKILKHLQSKALRMIVDAPWYVPNTLVRRDLQIPSIKEEISHYSSHFSARLTAHPNDTLLTLLQTPEHRRL
jgi:hypothetical protein